MRHRMRGRHFSRTSSHRRSMRRNLACNLFLHERIKTTPEKAKDTRSFVEKLITLARTDSVANFRRALALLDDKYVVRKLFREIGPRYADRPGGYTRILKLDESQNRLGDNARQVIFELVVETDADREAKEQARRKVTRETRLKRFAEEEETPPAPAEQGAVETAEAPSEPEAEPPQEAPGPEAEAPTGPEAEPPQEAPKAEAPDEEGAEEES